jgi:hypothetical protein
MNSEQECSSPPLHEHRTENVPAELPQPWTPIQSLVMKYEQECSSPPLHEHRTENVPAELPQPLGLLSRAS